MTRLRPTRRAVLVSGVAASASSLAAAPAFGVPQFIRTGRPTFPGGVQTGDVSANSAMIWTRADRPARVLCEVSPTESFANPVRLPPMDALPDAGFTAKRLLEGLSPDQTWFYRLTLADLSDVNLVSEPIVGQFRTAPSRRRNIRFVWGGDTAGQGYGIDDQGMLTYAAMASHTPDFFIHSGDTVYADNPMPAEMRLRDGSMWRNRVLTPEKSKVAETLHEFREQWAYNLLDPHVSAMNARVPTFFQWDDHEVTNNWSDSKSLVNDTRYAEKSIQLLTARAARAFHEMTPLPITPSEPGRVYRKIAYGPSLDIFCLDLRSYRGPNGPAMETELSPASRILGETQVAWLKRELAASRATWKVIASDMPIGLIVWDDGQNRKGAEAIANGDPGQALGREMEIAELLTFIRDRRIRNTVWVTADVHYTAAHHYDPARATYKAFAPFWEFVSGPLHAGTFGPGELDKTFGPEVRFFKAPTAEQGQNLPPSAGLQFFGLVDIDGRTEQMKVRLMDRANTELWSTVLDPVR